MSFSASGPADSYVGKRESEREKLRREEETLRQFEMGKHVREAEKLEQARLLEEHNRKKEALKKKGSWWRFFIGI